MLDLHVLNCEYHQTKGKNEADEKAPNDVLNNAIDNPGQNETKKCKHSVF